MTVKLTPELRDALARQQTGRPLPVEDPETHMRYVLVQFEVFERMLRALDYDATEPDPRSFYPAFAEAVKDDLDAPGMEDYDEDTSPRNDA